MAYLSGRSLTIVVYAVGFLDLLSVSMIYPLLIKHSKNLGASPSAVGLFGSLYGFLQFFTSPMMGQLSDTYGRQKLLLVSLLGTALSYFCLGFASSILLLVLARIPSGIFKHSQSMSRNYLADICSQSERAAAFGNFNAVSSIGFIIGPTAAGWLMMTENGFLKVALLSTTIFLINAMLVFFFIPPVAGAQKEKKETEGLLSSLTTLTKVPWHQMWDLFIISFLLSLSMIAFRANFTSVLTHRFGTDDLMNGYVLSFNGIVSTISGVLVQFISPWFSSNSQMHNTFAVGMVASLLAITIAPSFTLVVLLLIPLCLSSSVLRVTNATGIYSRADPNTRGLIVGAGNTLTSLARTLGPTFAGFAQEISIYGPGWTGVVIAALGTLIGFIAPDISMKEHQS